MIQNAVQRYQMGMATGVTGFFRSLVGPLIVAAFGVMLLSQISNLSALQESSGEKLAQFVASGEIHNAFRPMFALAAGVLALAFAAFSQMPERALRGKVSVAELVGE